MKSSVRVLIVLVIVVVGVVLWQTSRQGQDAVEQPTQELTSVFFTSERGIKIQVDEPVVGAVVTSPLKVSGEAPGTWYFEATFPIVVVNWDGLIIGEGFAQAQSDWMTSEYVPFVGRVEFGEILPLTKGEPEGVAGSPDFMKKGFLILQRDNPSDLPANDDAVEMPIRFAE